MSLDLDKFARLSKKIYDDYRTALMTQLYYARRLATLKKYNLWYEILLAFGTSSAIAGWYVLQTGPGKKVWAFFAGLVAILTTIKPILNLPKEIERLSKQNAGYQDVYFDLRQLVDDIESNAAITEKMEEVLATTRARSRSLAPDDDSNPKKEVLDRCQTEVNGSIIDFAEWFQEIGNRVKTKEDSNAIREKSE